MTENIAELYISEIADLYLSSEKDLDKLRAGSDKINQLLGDYYWDDVRHALHFYYARKNDKTRPMLAQVVALLETNKDVQKRIPDVGPVKQWHRPTTKIASIRDAFDKLVQILIDCGYMQDDNGKFKNTHALIDENGLPMLNAMDTLQSKLNSVKRHNPDLFYMLPHANNLEQLAIAVTNKKIVLRVREWSKYAAQNPDAVQQARGLF